MERQEENNQHQNERGVRDSGSKITRRSRGSRKSSRLGGPDLSDDGVTNPSQGKPRRTYKQRTEGEIPELFPVPPKPSHLAWRERQSSSQYKKETAKTSPSMDHTGVPEMFPNTVASNNNSMEHEEKISAYSSLKTKKYSSIAGSKGTPELFPDTVASKKLQKEGQQYPHTYNSRKKHDGKTPDLFPGTVASSTQTAAKGSSHRLAKRNDSLTTKPPTTKSVTDASKKRKVVSKRGSRCRQVIERPATQAPMLDEPHGGYIASICQANASENVAGTSSRASFSNHTDSARHIQPGAVAVEGVDGGDGDDLYDDLVIDNENGNSASSRPTGLPEAQAVVDDGEVRIQGLGEGQMVLESELEANKELGLKGWIRQHRCLTAGLILCVVCGVLGGAIGAFSGVGGGGSAPTLAPTMKPTPSPTVYGFELLSPVLSTISPLDVLKDIDTPQHAALLWLLREDGLDVDFGKAQKLLQRYALVTIYFATNGPDWTRQSNFLSDQDECLWSEAVDGTVFGVRACNDQGMVLDLQLSSNNLRGTFPDEVVGIPFLEFLSAANNNMNGTIPKTLFSLVNVEDLRLFGNYFVGSLPDSFGNIAKLTHLDVGKNALTGSLPASIGVATDLNYLNMLDNEFSGPLPTVLGKLVNLKHLLLQGNRLSGVVPSEVSYMTSLLVIFLNNNEFVGSMDPFCNGNIDFNRFRSDCLGVDRPGETNIVAEVNCTCCTHCCSDEDRHLCRSN